jgi:4-amino-4-deoxy-L-arabinose transferase-like glycosyltransferase
MMRWRSSGWQVAAVAVGLMLLYGLTAPRTVALEDDGVFIMASYTLGVAHPPGYPLHTLLGWLFTHLPFGTVEWRAHFLSGVFGALTCAVLWLLARRLTGSALAAWVSALALGLSQVFWSQAIIAEVYTLNTFLFVTAWLLVVAYRDSGRWQTLHWAALVCGLGLANHWPLFLLSAPGLLLTALPRWRAWGRQGATALLLFLMTAALPYCWLYARSRMNPGFSFLGPLEGVGDLWRVIARQVYDVSDSISATTADKLAFLRFYGREMAWQFTPAGVPLVLLGLVLALRRWGLTLGCGLVAAWLGGGVVLILLLENDYEYLNQCAFRVYPLIPYLAMALLLGVVAEWVSRWGGARRGRVAAVALLVLLAGGLLAQNLRQNNRAGYHWAAEVAALMLNQCETNAVLFLHGDLDAAPVGTLQVVHGVRRDLQLVQNNGFGFAAGLGRPLHSTADQRAEQRKQYAQGCGRPVYYVEQAPAPGGSVDAGLVIKWLPPGQSSSVSVSPAMLELLMRLVADRPDDPWTIYLRQRLCNIYGRLLTHMHYVAPDEAARAWLRPYREAVCSNEFGRLGMLGVGATVTREPPEQLLRWLAELEQADCPTASKEDRSLIHRCRARIYRHQGNDAGAVVELWKCLDDYPSPRNAGALQELVALLSARKDHAGLQEVTRRYGRWAKLQYKPARP